jgi:hypothetical protein
MGNNKRGGDFMQPGLNLDFNELLVGTRFFTELSNLLFGADLALKYAGIENDVIIDIKKRIVRSAISNIKIDFHSILNPLSEKSSYTSEEYEVNPLYKIPEEKGRANYSFTEQSKDTEDSGEEKQDALDVDYIPRSPFLH